MDFTHFDENNNAIMVDVSKKESTKRKAISSGKIRMSEDCYKAVRIGSVHKGDVLGVARIAGITAVKQTALIIPLCHTILLEQVSVDFEFNDEEKSISAYCTVKTTGITGVEMESLMGVSIALLTIYDMCKALDKSMEIGEISLAEKTGGKSGIYKKQEK